LPSSGAGGAAGLHLIKQKPVFCAATRFVGGWHAGC
jgi:hypothetical protein